MSQATQTSKRAEQERLLLEVRQKVYMRAVTGIFARWRWGMVWFTQLLFYGLPWLSWNDRQAWLFDLAARKFHIFGLVFYPQDFIYLAGLLILSALSLFLFTAVAGRLWCGYTCPQTVYTEIFMWIERKIEGDRGRRMKLDKAPRSWAKIRLKATKHAAWILVALITGFTFVGYFTPIRELAGLVVTLSLGPWQSFWILFYGLATYGNAGFLREQVCKYMCPYARFQGVMVDRDTMVITYDPHRGEPRGPRSTRIAHADLAAKGRGDCVDCSLCVQVCPTGIDIRNGQQYECIGCAACIDACDQVMEKVGYPMGLIRYDTLNALDGKVSHHQLLRRVFRLRVLIYATILLALATALTTHIFTRMPFKVDVIRDRGSLAREVKNGYIENVYRLNFINTEEQARDFTLGVQGLDGIAIDSLAGVSVESTEHKVVPVRVRVPPGVGEPGSNRIEFVVTATDDTNLELVESATFFVPELP